MQRAFRPQGACSRSQDPETDIAALHVVTQIVMWIAVALTLISLVDYIMKNIDVIKEAD